MKNKKDILNDLLAGKTTKCCENCKYFILREDKYAQCVDGDCSLEEDTDESFCFGFEICDNYKEIEE